MTVHDGKDANYTNVYQKNTTVASLTASQKFRLEQVSSNGTNRVVDIQRVGTKPTAGKLDIKFEKHINTGELMDESKHFNIDIALDLGLSYDSDIPYTFRLNEKVMMRDNDRRIICLRVSPEAIIVITDPPENKYPGWDAPRGECVNNVYAFDASGNQIWDFETLVGGKHYPILGGGFLEDEEKDVYAKYFHLPIVKSHRYFSAFTFADEHYIIDITEQKFIGRVAHR